MCLRQRITGTPMVCRMSMGLFPSLLGVKVTHKRGTQEKLSVEELLNEASHQ